MHAKKKIMGISFITYLICAVTVLGRQRTEIIIGGYWISTDYYVPIKNDIISPLLQM
jgi:hypothetical protein